MNTRSIILGFVFLFSSINIFSLTSSAHQLISSSAPQLANSPTRQLANSNYSRQWKKVDSLSGLGLPKSALQLVQEIYEQAKKEKNDAQYIKAIIYRLKLSADFREDVMVKSIKEVRAEINNAKEPVRQILESVLGEIYSNYSRNNRYRFQDRTQVMNNNSDSIQTWDLKTLSRRTERCYLLSLENPSLLKSIPVEKFEPILEQPGTNGDPVSKKTADPYRPTLYDFLAWRALDYFSSSLNEDKVTVDVFTLDKSSYFSQAAGFASMKFDFPGDSSSSLAYAIGLYRDLAAFHLPDKDPGERHCGWKGQSLF
jgi:hypothetical protein